MKYDGQNMEEQNIPVVKEIFSNAYPMDVVTFSNLE